MSDFVAHPSRRRISLLILAAGAFVLLGLWLTGIFGEVPEPSRRSATFSAMIGWLNVVFFGFCLVAAVPRLLDKDVVLRVGPDGLFWARWSDATIPWNEIVEVTEWKYQRSRCIVLTLRDRDRYPAQTYMKVFNRVNRAMTGGDIAISLTGTDRSFSAALSAIEEFRAKASCT